MKFEELLPYWPVPVAITLLIAGVASYFAWLRKRPDAGELERRRREQINRIGKMGDGTISEVQNDLACYKYQVRGIEYQATQDVSGLEAYLPEEKWGIIGSVGIKYDPRNPANSIFLCEKWSGLRKASARV
jgi:hypothetical protein